MVRYLKTNSTRTKFILKVNTTNLSFKIVVSNFDKDEKVKTNLIRMNSTLEGDWR